MKLVTAIFSTLTVLGAVMAGVPDDLPACGKTCINNLLGDAANFGCSAGGDGEAACLCSNATFTYGIRDCSNESCGDSAAASSVISYGISYCSSAGVAIPTTIETVTSGTVSPTATGGNAGTGSASGSGSAITTSSFLTTVTSDGSTITTSAATTIFAGGAAASGSSLSSSLSSEASSASGSLTSALSSISSAASSGASGAASSATDSSSSSAFAPQMTAAPVGFLAAAGIAAMLL